LLNLLSLPSDPSSNLGPVPSLLAFQHPAGQHRHRGWATEGGGDMSVKYGMLINLPKGELM